jgi:hypothetical protein
MAITVLAFCTMLAFNGSVTNAQDALGRGDALDANPGVGTGGYNVPSPAIDFRARNLLITGDVAGGRGFRGSVGYFAEGDFRGELGSDDLFRFRADAAFSSPRLAGLGRMADPFRFGQDLAILEFRRSAMELDYARRSADFAESDRRWETVPGDDRLIAERIDHRVNAGLMDEALRVRERSDRDISQRPIGARWGEEDSIHVASVSPLRGLSYVDERVHAATRDLPDLDLARSLDDVQRGLREVPIGTRTPTRFAEQLRVESRVREESPDARVEIAPLSGQRAPHVDILERIAHRYAGLENVHVVIDESMLAELDEQFDELRAQLRAMRVPTVPVRDPLLVDRDEDDMAEPEPAARPDAPEPDQLLPDLTLDMLRHDFEIDRLAMSDGSRTNELIIGGQASLRRGEYFDAESSFARALRLSPNHPMAMIGMAHAQLGGGLHQSAAITLRRAFSEHPELIGTRYDARLLPQERRMVQIIADLRDQIGKPDAPDGIGLLLAYIGHHRQDRELLEAGLTEMQRRDATDPLLPIVRGVWLERENSSPNRRGESSRSPSQTPSPSPDK